MVPAGDATEQTVWALAERMRRETRSSTAATPISKTTSAVRGVAPPGLHYVDVGTSGGVWGIDRGYCLMIGGPEEAVRRLDAVFKTLAPGRGDLPRTPHREKLDARAEEGYLHCGPVGAGHFVKMVHNGIEYGLMQSYAEGLDILRGVAAGPVPAERRYQLNLADITEVWRRGSVIGSWLLDLTAMALAENPDLSNFTGAVQDSGEGRWTVEAAVEEAVPAAVLTSALYTRFRSRAEHEFAEKVLSAMRSQVRRPRRAPQRRLADFTILLARELTTILEYKCGPR